MSFLRTFLMPVSLAVLVLAAFMLGVFFRGFDQFYFAPGLLCVSAVALILVDPFRRRDWRLPWDGSSRVLLCFWGWLAISVLWSDVSNISMTFLHLIGAMPLLFFCLVQHPDASRLNRVVLWAVGAALFLIAVWAVFQFVFLYDLVGYRVHHPMLNANNLAVILAMAVFIFLSLMLQSGPVLRVIALVAAGGCIAGVLVTESRGGVLGLLVGGGVLSCLFLMRGRAVSLGKNWKIYAIVFCALLLALGLLAAGILVRSDDFRLLTGGMGSITERFLIWGAAWSMMFERPLFGPGLGLFYLLYPSRRPYADMSDGFFVHWDPLQFGLETGVLAMVLFYAFAVFVLLRTIRAAGVANDPGGRMRIMVPFCGLLSLMINAHVNFDLYMLPAQMLAGLLLVQWFLETERVLGSARIQIEWSMPVQRVLIVVVLAFLFVLSPVWIARAGFSVYAVEKATAETAEGDDDGSRRWLDMALRYGDPSYYRAYFVDAQWYGRILQKNFNAVTAQERADLLGAAHDSIDRAIEENPYYSHAYNYKAILYAMSYPRLDPHGDDKAIETLHKALELDPFNFDARLGLARLYDARGQTARALSVLDDAQKWAAVQEYGPPVYRLEILRLMEKLNHPDTEAYRATLQEALELHNIRIESRSAVDGWVRERLHALFN